MASIWSEHRTKEGRVYYYNRQSKQSTWEKPKDFDGAAEAGNDESADAAASASTSAASSSAEWEELWDPKNARPYYYHRATRKTQWLKPEGVEIKPYAGAKTAAGKKDKTGRKAHEKDKDKDKAAEESADAASGNAAAGDVEKVAAKSSSGGKKSGGKTRHGSVGDLTTKASASAAHDEDKKKKTRDVADAEAEQDNGRGAEGDADGGDGDADAAQSHSRRSSSEAAHAKKRRKKAKKESSGEFTATIKKRPRKASERMIICDDEDRMKQEAHKAVQEQDTEDGKEATRVLRELSETDAIMQANVLALINAFLRTHTEPNGPEILVEKLSSSYRGHAQMVGLVASWLDALPVSKAALERKLTFETAGENAGPSKCASWNPATDILYDHLKDIVMEHYEPELVSNVLSGSATEPEWLTEMLGDKKWRMMLIELAEKHKTCTLLQYAVRRISEAGHHKELAAISNANSFFSVFNGILLDTCCRIPFASDEDAREDLTALKMICCRSAFSYVYAEEVLCTLDHKLFLLQDDESNEPNHRAHYRTVRSKLSRVRLELQEVAIEKFGAKIEAFHPLHRRSLYESNSSLSEAILSIVKTKKCSEAAAELLVQEYRSHEEAPPVAHLRDPLVFRSILDPLFNPSESLSDAFAADCTHLLAYASCAKDERSILHSNINGASVVLDEDELVKTKASIEEASRICRSDHTLSFNMNQSGVVEKLADVMRVPVASIGVLHWLEVTLRSPAFFNSSLLHICFPSLLRILKESIRLHVAQWPIAFRLLVVSLRLHPDVNPVKALELKRESLDSMIFMITSGYVLPVLEFIFANISDLDQALLRNFVTVLFAQIAPPYSAKFVVALAKILTHPKVQNAIKSCPAEFKTKLRGFVSYCKKNPSVLASDRLQALVSAHDAM